MLSQEPPLLRNGEIGKLQASRNQLTIDLVAPDGSVARQLYRSEVEGIASFGLGLTATALITPEENLAHGAMPLDLKGLIPSK
jgi:hypothetical protein